MCVMYLVSMSTFRKAFIAIAVFLGLTVASFSPASADYGVRWYGTKICPAGYYIKLTERVTGHSYLAIYPRDGSATKAYTVAASDSQTYTYTQYFYNGYADWVVAAHTAIYSVSADCWRPSW